MSTLKELRQTLLTISHPERVLRMADHYLAEFEKLGDSFVLPAEYKIVKPVLEYYANDIGGWVKFLKGTRDRLPRGSDEYHEVHELYKVVNVRAIQRRTRALIDAATDVACRKGLLDNTWDAKQRYAKRCIQAWKMRKDNMLDAIRRVSPTGRVSQDHRERELAAFWQLVEQEVNNGEVPKP